MVVVLAWVKACAWTVGRLSLQGIRRPLWEQGIQKQISVENQEQLFNRMAGEKWGSPGCW